MMLCGVLGLGFIGVIIRSFRRRERAVKAQQSLTRMSQYACIGLAIYALSMRPGETWQWIMLALLGAAGWGWQAYREMVQEELLNHAIKARMSDYEHWPEPPRDDSSINPYADDRFMGTWGGVAVRLAPGPESIRLEIDVPDWPRDMLMVRKGTRGGAAMSTGDPEFDRCVHVKGLSDGPSSDCLHILVPAARSAVIRGMDELGAELENGMITLRLQHDAHEVLLENFGRRGHGWTVE